MLLDDSGASGTGTVRSDSPRRVLANQWKDSLHGGLVPGKSPRIVPRQVVRAIRSVWLRLAASRSAAGQSR